MVNTKIERTEARVEKNTEWRLSNEENAHFLNVIFSKELENAMKDNRNFSFSRFESEQLNYLRPLVEKLDSDYELTLDKSVIGSDFLPLSSKDAVHLLKKVSA
ncbi:hypothetical protein JCM15457_1416 [Liquorilactobacillus sucicola DSM 21376 = JCM 15457]|uniref:Uncharacterized protein n=1 Tax=Liquorilactobacillus sucicola DSM 21376 = JCM 15457 TaxID=1423806 RepID=A0A023CX86_9LACO|nr:hypothetical protein [Liquorilactobacillus sucicola]KRN07001.1 hypothetical protein FD15_GL000564 [Liquorilactobacillus sucicola DSM 21376 = JCM 15457]GAJ26487.1 hypothetical protein JCM15457_1416 [Liquorilactobacillus sucicola DSM 21376 = JCM 15457]